MQNPANFESASLDGLLNDWAGALRDLSVEAVVVLGPDPFGDAHARQVVAVHPPRLRDAAQALANSHDFGLRWRESDAPLAAWQLIARAGESQVGEWRSLWMAHGLHTMVRVEFPLPAGRAFECFLFSPRELAGRSDAASLAWSALNIWPLVKRAICEVRCPLSPRERECLQLAFEGLTARQSAARMTCSERTVNFHLANAMAKLRVKSKLAAIRRACWLGAI